MSAVLSQITRVSIDYPTVCSGADQRKHQTPASQAYVRRNSTVIDEFPAQRASNAENVNSFDDVIMPRNAFVSIWVKMSFDVWHETATT